MRSPYPAMLRSVDFQLPTDSIETSVHRSKETFAPVRCVVIRTTRRLHRCRALPEAEATASPRAVSDSIPSRLPSGAAARIGVCLGETEIEIVSLLDRESNRFVFIGNAVRELFDELELPGRR